jgi:hypothetical protein
MLRDSRQRDEARMMLSETYLFSEVQDPQCRGCGRIRDTGLTAIGQRLWSDV